MAPRHAPTASLPSAAHARLLHEGLAPLEAICAKRVLRLSVTKMRSYVDIYGLTCSEGGMAVPIGKAELRRALRHSVAGRPPRDVVLPGVETLPWCARRKKRKEVLPVPKDTAVPDVKRIKRRGGGRARQRAGKKVSAVSAELRTAVAVIPEGSAVRDVGAGPMSPVWSAGPGEAQDTFRSAGVQFRTRGVAVSSAMLSLLLDRDVLGGAWSALGPEAVFEGCGLLDAKSVEGAGLYTGRGVEFAEDLAVFMTEQADSANGGQDPL